MTDENNYYKISEEELDKLQDFAEEANYWFSGLNMDNADNDELKSAWRGMTNLGIVVKILREEFTKIE